VHRVALVLVLLVACGHPPKQPDTAKPTGDPTKLPDGAPLVTPGERMQYRVSLQGVDIAQYNFEVGEVLDLNGKRAIVVQGHAKAVGLAQMLGGNVDDHFTSWLDIQTGRSLRFQVDEFASHAQDIEHTVIDLAGRKGDMVPATFHLNDKPPAPEPQKTSLAETWDFNAFLVAMRAWEGNPGTTVPIEVFRSRNLWHVDIKIHGRERLVTELGDLPALRIDAHLYKLDRAGQKDKGSDEREFSLWISDDDGRVPLQINAKTDYGDVKMQIVDYQPGTGERLRK
jgi:hypothetical protein